MHFNMNFLPFSEGKTCYICFFKNTEQLFLSGKLLLSHLEDSGIDENHDHQRYIEGDDRGSALNDVAGSERDHSQAHQEIRACQRSDEVVSDRLQPLEFGDGRDHQHVAKEDGQHDQRHENGHAHHPAFSRRGGIVRALPVTGVGAQREVHRIDGAQRHHCAR
ncbi:hypothetical protein E2320_015523 [Naja naja]|nr:hypothetical protein E2320_015523 [Naja naja]